MLNTTINGYTIRRHIGSGNFGDVYLGENRLGVRCALKVLQRRYIEDKGIVHRFEQEAHAMCRLDHPNVRRAIDLVWIDGVPAILMEYLEGHTLKDLILSSSCSDRELRGWFVALGTALMQLHRQRIIHRDIKPANIFITTDGTVKLLDFGIAKVLDGPDMSLTGSKLGTLIYSSPEQVRDPRKVGVQTDIYSLAVTFHHAVTGRLPYDRNAQGDGEITIKIVQQDLPIDHLPRHWQQALSYCLHKDAEKRDLHKAILQLTGGYDSKLGGGITNETELDYGGEQKTEFETDPQRGRITPDSNPFTEVELRDQLKNERRFDKGQITKVSDAREEQGCSLTEPVYPQDDEDVIGVGDYSRENRISLHLFDPDSVIMYLRKDTCVVACITNGGGGVNILYRHPSGLRLFSTEDELRVLIHDVMASLRLKGLFIDSVAIVACSHPFKFRLLVDESVANGNAMMPTFKRIISHAMCEALRFESGHKEYAAFFIDEKDERTVISSISIGDDVFEDCGVFWCDKNHGIKDAVERLKESNVMVMDSLGKSEMRTYPSHHMEEPWYGLVHMYNSLRGYSSKLAINQIGCSLMVRVEGESLWNTVVDKDETLPCKKSHVISNQNFKSILFFAVVARFPFFASDDAEDMPLQLFAYTIDGMPEEPQGKLKIKVTFEVDANSNLSVSFASNFGLSSCNIKKTTQYIRANVNDINDLTWP